MIEIHIETDSRPFVEDFGATVAEVLEGCARIASRKWSRKRVWTKTLLLDPGGDLIGTVEIKKDRGE